MYVLIIIPHEEKFLLERFGAKYELYKKSTPAIFPNPFGRRDKANSASRVFDAEKSWFMERHSLRMNIAVTILVFSRVYFFAEW
jgi:hypothetical protein